MRRSIEPSNVGGRVRAPASKSVMQRAIACASMAPGISTILKPSWSDDCVAAMRVASALGARIERLPDRLIIEGGLAFGEDVPLSVSCGESGLCIRMFSAIASLLSVPVELLAEGSLQHRPLGIMSDALIPLGVSLNTRAGLPPVRVCGPLYSGHIHVDASYSSQFLSGLLLALPLARQGGKPVARQGAKPEARGAWAKGASRISLSGLASRGYIDLTLELMRAFGVSAKRDSGYREFTIECGDYEAREYEVEGDWSSAAFLLVAGAIASSPSGPGLLVEGLSASSLQPDRAILDALALAGADILSIRGAYSVKGRRLRGFSFDASGCPDLFPPLVTLASRCEGQTRLLGVGRLRNKESDRAMALSEAFGALGLPLIVDGDEMRIEGRSSLSRARLSGGTVSARGDHRIAMAVAVAALAAEETVHIDGAESITKSWPGFFEDIESVMI